MELLPAQPVSPTVLAQNRALGRRLSELEHQMDSAKEQLKHLNYENLQKDALLRACTDGKHCGTTCDSSSCQTTNIAVPYSTLCKKVKTLEEENARLQKEAATLHNRVTSAAESHRLTTRCMRELEDARFQMEDLSRELESKTEQCNRFRSERAAIQQLLGDAHGHAKQLAAENVELEEYLRTAKDAQAELRSEICELRTKYSDYFALIAALKDHITKEKQETLMHHVNCENLQFGSKPTPQLEAVSQPRLPIPTIHSRSEQTRRVRRRSRQRSRVNRRGTAAPNPDAMPVVFYSLNLVDCFRVAFAAPLLARTAGGSLLSPDGGGCCTDSSEVPAACSSDTENESSDPAFAADIFVRRGHFGVSRRLAYGYPMPLHKTITLSSECKVTPRCAFCKNFFIDDPGKRLMLMPFEGPCNCRQWREVVTPSRLEAALMLIIASGTRVSLRSDVRPPSSWSASFVRTRGVASGCSVMSENAECERRKNCFFLRLLEPSLKAWRALRQSTLIVDMERKSSRPYF